MRAHLARPSTAYKVSYIAAICEFQQHDQSHLGDDLNWLDAHFDVWVRRLRALETDPPVGWVPSTDWWLVAGNVYLGRASVRHALNDNLRQLGGHIGYEIRPSKRRQGYGTLICKLALVEAQALGLQRVLITCSEDNLGSRKIIEANGGQFEKAVQLPQHKARTRHYWVEL